MSIAIEAKHVYHAFMRYLLAALLAMVLLTGCETDGEDHAFFYEGWRHPEKASEERLMTR